MANSKITAENPAPPNLRRAAHKWYKTRQNSIAANRVGGAEAVIEGAKHARAIQKLAGVVAFDMRTGGEEP